MLGKAAARKRRRDTLNANLSTPDDYAAHRPNKQASNFLQRAHMPGYKDSENRNTSYQSTQVCTYVDWTYSGQFGPSQAQVSADAGQVCPTTVPRQPKSAQSQPKSAPHSPKYDPSHTQVNPSQPQTRSSQPQSTPSHPHLRPCLLHLHLRHTRLPHQLRQHPRLSPKKMTVS